jgi:hypothetical protein
MKTQRLAIVPPAPPPCTNTVQDIETPAISDREDLFLSLLSEGVSVCEACARAGIPRRSAYARRREDKDFATLWDEALAMAADTLEAEADRRGRDGWSEDVYYRGQVIGQRRRYSDRMLMFRLKALRPEMYKCNT